MCRFCSIFLNDGQLLLVKDALFRTSYSALQCRMKITGSSASVCQKKISLSTIFHNRHRRLRRLIVAALPCWLMISTHRHTLTHRRAHRTHTHLYTQSRTWHTLTHTHSHSHTLSLTHTLTHTHSHSHT